MSDHYCTLFSGRLVQESALSVGGTASGSSVDDPLCRDGRGRFTLTGRTLAGALLATARKLYDDKQLAGIGRPPRPSRETEAPPDSLWRVFNVHPRNDPQVELRACVGIRQATGAARDGALFDVEVLPYGTEWDFLLEVNTSAPGGLEAEGIAFAALREWRRRRGWIGRHVARGLGWMRLEGLVAYRLRREHFASWPNSWQDPWSALHALPIEPLPEKQLVEAIVIPPLSQAWYYHELEATVVVGEQINGYGVDALSVGGHAARALEATWNDAHFVAPGWRRMDDIAASYEPDHAVVMSTAPGGQAEPVLPGASQRGCLRHCLSRHLRAEGGTLVSDPLVSPRKRLSAATEDGAPNRAPDEVEALFGDLVDESPLLIRDAHLKSDEWRGVWLQQHAEDEFSAGVYGSGKFDRMAVLRGLFGSRLVIQGSSRERVEAQARLLDKALAYARQGHLPIGGQQWRGLGWCRWEIPDAGRVERAGEGTET